MVGGAIRRCGLEHHAWRYQRRAIRLFFKRRFANVLDFVVVVKQIRFVGVDVPDAHARHLRRQAGAGKCVVQMAQLAVEQVGIGASAQQRRRKIRIAATGDRGDRILLGVGVEIAEQQDLRVACSRKDRAVDPAQQARRLRGTRCIGKALSIANIGITGQPGA